MTTIRKTFPVTRKTIDAEAGIYEAMISTEDVDRDGDVLLAEGVQLDNFLRNPVVLFGHQYNSVDAVVGKAIEVAAIPGQGLRARFQFADASVNPKADIVRRLWAGEFLNATSVGFIPKASMPRREEGRNGETRGLVFQQWELLEFSIVPVPANQSALRLAVKSLLSEDQVARVAKAVLRHKSPACRQDGETHDECVSRKIPEIREENPDMDMDQCTAIAESMCEEACADKSAPAGEPESLAWIRRLTVESNLGPQTVFACYRQYTITVPKDAQKWMSDKENGLYPAPHPYAGKSINQKEVFFVPPIEYDDADWGKDCCYSMLASGVEDTELVKGGTDWEVKELSEILLTLPRTKGVKVADPFTLGVCKLEDHDVRRLKGILTKMTKRGRVLSAKNEESLRGAQADIDAAKTKIDGVLEQLDEQPRESNDEGKEASVKDASDTRELEQALLEGTKTLTTFVRRLT